jgi:hypothetical protein
VTESVDTNSDTNNSFPEIRPLFIPQSVTDVCEDERTRVEPSRNERYGRRSSRDVRFAPEIDRLLCSSKMTLWANNCLTHRNMSAYTIDEPMSDLDGRI